MNTEHHELVAILDFGGQYTQLIARRVRDLHVFSEIVPCDTSATKFAERSPKALIFSGGPASVYADGAPTCDPAIFELGLPVLGICYGAQLMATLLGGSVERAASGEYGQTVVSLSPSSRMFRGLPPEIATWMSHMDRIHDVPAGFEVTAGTAVCPVAAMEDSTRHLYALQFHPEVAQTTAGTQILERFLFDIAGCSGDWTMESLMNTAVQDMRSRIGEKRALCALSGGVDSSVAAALAYRAVGQQLCCVFVDTGLLRAGEGDQVEATFRGHFGAPLVRVDAGDRFFAALEGITDPEQKRKAVGSTFISCFAEQARTAQDAQFLVQGTLYPDVIESGSPVAHTIKSHHNVGGLPADLGFDLVEPLRLLFKDEVRNLGRILGLPEGLVTRQPFPGPGLSVRIVGEVTRKKVDIVRRADAVVERVMRQSGWYDKVWQSFAVLPDVRSVGVQGDTRTYGHTIAVRVVDSSDGMTADWVRLPSEVLHELSQAIVSEVPEVNRVVYDITSKPPATIEWE